MGNHSIDAVCRVCGLHRDLRGGLHYLSNPTSILVTVNEALRSGYKATEYNDWCCGVKMLSDSILTFRSPPPPTVWERLDWDDLDDD